MGSGSDRKAHLYVRHQCQHHFASGFLVSICRGSPFVPGAGLPYLVPPWHPMSTTCMQCNGSYCHPMAGHRIIWPHLASHGPRWHPMPAIGIPWPAVASSRRHWHPIAAIGIPWAAMESHRRYWRPMAGHGMAWHGMSGGPAHPALGTLTIRGTERVG